MILWCATNLLWFDRRKCLLLTHSATLFRRLRFSARSLRHTDIDALSQSLRRNSNRARGYRPPIELALERGWRTPGPLGASDRTRAR